MIENNKNSLKKETKAVSDTTRKQIQSRVIKLERYNYNQKEFGPIEMVSKIKKIIEQEVENDSKKTNTK